ncbi:MAG: HAD-IB family hydrolase [Desulfobacterales bacterium]|nr:HAD-IB family hydrolase [Desulfobacterales bacterium]
MNLALFDFDGTITNKDTFKDFIYIAASPKRIFWGRLALVPIILGYKLKLIPASKTREIVAGLAFKGRDINDLRLAGEEYARDIIPKYLRPKALEKIQWHKDRGDSIAVVSASLDIYLDAWCKSQSLDIICSKIESHNGVVTGRYTPKDCSGPEKAKRVKAKYNLKSFQRIYAYGDTSEDNELLALANIKYYRGKRV